VKLSTRRAFFRDLGVFSAAAALGAAPRLLKAQTPPDPFTNDVTIFFIGPWLFFANAPGRPGRMLALTVDDPMHSYHHGIYRGARPTTDLPARDYAVTIPGSHASASTDLFGPLSSASGVAADPSAQAR